MDEEIESVYDPKWTEEMIEADDKLREDIKTRQMTRPKQVIDYQTFTRVDNPNPWYFRRLLKYKNQMEYVDQRGFENFCFNIFLPLPMVGSLTISSRKRRKEARKLSEFPSPINTVVETIAGSSGEGLSLPQMVHIKGQTATINAPDEDRKYVFTNLVVHPEKRSAFARAEPSPGSPSSFIKLKYNRDFSCKDKSQNEISMARIMTESGYVNREKFVSLMRAVLKKYVHSYKREQSVFRTKEGQDPKITFSHHGPAITVDIEDEEMKITYSKDYVLCLPCPQWPEQAREWQTRKRVWPNKEVVRKISQEGCHVIPKAFKGKGNAQKTTEFLYSFSMCDRTLSQYLGQCQRRGYMLFKYVFKHRLSKVKRGLTSYHCKLAFQWLCERKGEEQWTEDNPVECLIMLLEEFKRFLSSHMLPHYWIPSHNMLDQMSKGALAACVRDVEHVLISPWKTVLQLSENHRFLWLSRDVSLRSILPSLKSDMKISRKLVTTSFLTFLSVMLDKGEIHLCLSIIAEKWACEIEAETNTSIRALEYIIETYDGVTDMVCFKGLVANLYHQLGEECILKMVDCKDGIEKSYDTFHELKDIVGPHIWIYGAFYDFLDASGQFEEIIKHFKLNVQGKRLYETGIYTAFTYHNSLTSVLYHFASISDVFIVPTTAYLLYKVASAYVAVSKNSNNVLQSSAYRNEAQKVLKHMERWVREKCRLYPESTDDFLYFILGQTALEVGDAAVSQTAFKEACSYGQTFARIQFSPEQNALDVKDEASSSTRGKCTRFHPYRKSKKSPPFYSVPDDMKFLAGNFRMGPYVHSL